MNNPQAGDLILFQLADDKWVVNGLWVAVFYPILTIKLYANNYNSIEQKALAYAADWAKMGKIVSVWKQIDANKNKYFKVL